MRTDDPKTLRIDHDDNAIDIMEEVNRKLALHGLSFEDDGEEHDGYVLYRIVSHTSRST